MHSKGTPTGLQHLTALSVLLGIAVCVHSPALASAAALGKTYPIAERDFLDVIHERLQAKQAAGEIDAMQQAMRATALNTIENPTPIPGISRATQAQTHYYDPSVVAEKAIHDASGKVVVAAGTRVNPLEYLGPVSYTHLDVYKRQLPYWWIKAKKPGLSMQKWELERP